MTSLNIVARTCALALKALADQGIPFTCHWGQLGNGTPERVQQFYGAKAATWKTARHELLGQTGMKLFGFAILADAGLDG